MSETTFNSILGSFELLRRPHTPHLPLQAWDAADEYLLALAKEHFSVDAPTLIINDQFGALALLAAQAPVTSWGDSYTSHLAAQENLQRNHLALNRFSSLPATRIPTEKFTQVLWRIPKNIHLLQQQAAELRQCIGDETLIFAAGMQKHLPSQTAEILGKLGKTDYLLAQKKARAFKILPDLSLPTPAPPETRTLVLREFDFSLNAGANVFAHDKFDIGARFFLEQFEKLPRAQHIADLGCGNGVLGMRLKQLQPLAKVEFLDESYQAIAATEANYRANGLSETQPDATFNVDDIFSNYADDAFDLIVCNPPFHQGHVVGDHIAWQMFTQSRKHLRQGGELWIVGNRHLDYHLKLKKIFGNCRSVAANAKFVVLSARAQ